MKPTSRTLFRLPLLALPLLLADSALAQHAEGGGLVVPAKTEKLSVLDATVNLTSKSGTTLKVVVDDVVGQLPGAPSVIFKPGSESAPVPMMRVEGVRLQDLLDALQHLMRVHIEVLNPKAENGRPLIVVEAREQPVRPARPVPVTPARPAALPGVGAAPSAGSPATSGGAGIPGGTGTDLGWPGPRVAGGDAVSWSPERIAPTFTRTFALAALLEGEESHSNIIEAINTVWSTSVGGTLPTGDDGPRIAFHQPSSLLIIRANQQLQEQAEEVIANITAAREARQQAKRSEVAIQDMEKRAHREIEHLKQLHETMVRQLEAKYTAEIEKLQVRLQELETANNLLKTRLGAGGSR